MITNKSDIVKYQSTHHLGVPDNKIRDINLMIRTSGSTGNPLSVPMNAIDFKHITDVGAKCFQHAGVRPGMRIIHCLNFQMWAGGVLDFHSLMKSGAAAFPYGTGDTENLIDTILYYNIEGISCTPSYMKRIKQVLKSKYNMKPDQLGLKYGFFGGESGLQNPEFRDRIEKEWCIEAINANYGSADSISILASEDYRRRDGLTYLANDIAEAHILVGEDICIPKKGMVGNLLITTTYEGGLIRHNNYNIGDIIEVLSDGPNFKFKVLNRSDSMLVIKGLNLYPEALDKVISEVSTRYGCPDIRYQLLVSKEDPIEEAKIIIDEPFESMDIDTDMLCKDIQVEVDKQLNLKLPISSEYIISNTNKEQKVRRIL